MKENINNIKQNTDLIEKKPDVNMDFLEKRIQALHEIRETENLHLKECYSNFKEEDIGMLVNIFDKDLDIA